MTYGQRVDATDEPVWQDIASSRKRWVVVAASAAAVAALLAGAATAVFASGAKNPHRVTVTATTPAPSPIESSPTASEDPSESPSASPSRASASPSAKPSPSRSAQPSAAALKTALPVRKPTDTAVAPAPSAPASPAKDCPTHQGTDVSKAELRGYMEQASTTGFYYKSAPALRVPLNLIKAIAYQESGWQSSIVACDGGIGTMQVMPMTSDFLNKNVFAANLDINKPQDNVTQGAKYLAYLIKRFGDAYDPPLYDVSQNDMLLISVISAYQRGPGGVDATLGEAGIKNMEYVRPVRALMTNCPCLSY